MANLSNNMANLTPSERKAVLAALTNPAPVRVTFEAREALDAIRLLSSTRRVKATEALAALVNSDILAGRC